MIEQPATPPLKALGASPLLDGVEPQSRGFVEFLKFLGASLVGLVGGGVAAIGFLVVAVLLVIAMIAASGGDPGRVAEVMSALQSTGATDTLEMTIIVLAALASINTLFAVVFVLLAGLLRRRRLRASITSAPRFRWGQLFVGLILYGVALSALIGAEVLIGGEELRWPIFSLTDSAGEIALLAGVVIVGFMIAAFAEEILFRGWLLRETAVFTRNVWILLLINGVLFSAIHVNPMTWQLDPNAFVARTAMGMAFGYMALRFGGIEFAIGAHAANNILLTLVVEPLPLAEPPPEPMQAGPMAEGLVLLVIAVAITELAARAPVLRRVMSLGQPQRALSAG